MKTPLYLSFEQEATLADALEPAERYPGSPYKLALTIPSIKQDRLDFGYVTLADGNLYDGPGAKAAPGNVLALIGPIEEKHASEAMKHQADLLRSLGAEVLVCGEDY